MSVIIRAVRSEDQSEWQGLYRQYGEFYKVGMTDETLTTVWSWLHDPAHVVEGIVAEQDGKVVGLGHYRRMRIRCAGWKSVFWTTSLWTPRLAVPAWGNC